MSCNPTLEDYAPWTPEEVRELVLQVAHDAGPAGCTAEDIRLRAWWASSAPRSLSAIIASLVARGKLARVSDEIATFRSSKSRRLGRYVLTVQGGIE